MKINQLLNEIQDKIKNLDSLLKEKDICFDMFFSEMVECLNYIRGYSNRSFETDKIAKN